MCGVRYAVAVANAVAAHSALAHSRGGTSKPVDYALGTWVLVYVRLLMLTT